jgi:hypothetical protein
MKLNWVGVGWMGVSIAMTSIFVFCWSRRRYIPGEASRSRVTGSEEAKKAAEGQNSYEISAEKGKKRESKQKGIMSTLLSIHCIDDSEESQPMYIHALKSSLNEHMSPSLPLCHHKHLCIKSSSSTMPYPLLNHEPFSINKLCLFFMCSLFTCVSLL